MILEINQLISSHHEIVSKLGWLLYGREDQNGGLNKNEVEELMKLVNDSSVEKILSGAYDEGFNEGAGFYK